MIHRGDVLARITADLKAGIQRITGQPDHYMNKMSSARVKRAIEARIYWLCYRPIRPCASHRYSAQPVGARTEVAVAYQRSVGGNFLFLEKNFPT
jgi:hypothetical protein